MVFLLWERRRLEMRSLEEELQGQLRMSLLEPADGSHFVMDYVSQHRRLDSGPRVDP